MLRIIFGKGFTGENGEPSKDVVCFAHEGYDIHIALEDDPSVIPFTGGKMRKEDVLKLRRMLTAMLGGDKKWQKYLHGEI
jgi:hypothetical protein